MGTVRTVVRLFSSRRAKSRADAGSFILSGNQGKVKGIPDSKYSIKISFLFDGEILCNALHQGVHEKED